MLTSTGNGEVQAAMTFRDSQSFWGEAGDMARPGMASGKAIKVTY
jgi:hypothetical protein